MKASTTHCGKLLLSYQSRNINSRPQSTRIDNLGVPRDKLQSCLWTQLITRRAATEILSCAVGPLKKEFYVASCGPDCRLCFLPRGASAQIALVSRRSHALSEFDRPHARDGGVGFGT